MEDRVGKGSASVAESILQAEERRSQQGSVSVSESILQAEELRSQQDENSEMEFCCGEDTESDLHELKKRCLKNPGHTQFIPIKEFSSLHLSPEHRYLYPKIMELALRTVRIRVNSSLPPSGKRNKPFQLKAGSGIMFYENDRGKLCLSVRPCPLDPCPVSGSDHQVLGPIFVYTAFHVVQNARQAKYTEVDIFYDDPNDKSSVVVAHGVGWGFAKPDTDLTIVECVTHDLNLSRKLEERTQLLVEGFDTDLNKLSSSDEGSEDNCDVCLETKKNESTESLSLCQDASGNVIEGYAREQIFNLINEDSKSKTLQEENSVRGEIPQAEGKSKPLKGGQGEKCALTRAETEATNTIHSEGDSMMPVTRRGCEKRPEGRGLQGGYSEHGNLRDKQSDPERVSGRTQEQNIAVCISHPQGMSKHVSIGTFRDSRMQRYTSFEDDMLTKICETEIGDHQNVINTFQKLHKNHDSQVDPVLMKECVDSFFPTDTSFTLKLKEEINKEIKFAKMTREDSRGQSRIRDGDCLTDESARNCDSSVPVYPRQEIGLESMSDEDRKMLRETAKQLFDGIFLRWKEVLNLRPTRDQAISSSKTNGTEPHGEKVVPSIFEFNIASFIQRAMNGIDAVLSSERDLVRELKDLEQNLRKEFFRDCQLEPDVALHGSSYTVPTCPGSSGAIVYCQGLHGDMQTDSISFHSKGNQKTGINLGGLGFSLIDSWLCAPSVNKQKIVPEYMTDIELD